MNKSTKIKAMGIPYWNFKEKIRITKEFEKYYRIEDFGLYLVCVGIFVGVMSVVVLIFRHKQ